MNKKKWKIVLDGCDDSTRMEVVLTDEEANVIKKIANLSYKTSTYTCEPTMTIWAVSDNENV